jgi:hypothetical protein
MLLVDRATGEIARKTLTWTRNSWIKVANDSEVSGTMDPEVALLILDGSMAAQNETMRLSPPSGDRAAMATGRRRTCHKRSRMSWWLRSSGLA